MRDCEIYHCEQRSLEWHQLRKGVLTASNFGAWLTESPEVRLNCDEIKAILDEASIAYDKKAKKPDLIALLPNASQYMSLTEKAAAARESAICKLISERAGCWQNPNFENEAMLRGIRMEPEAVAAFEKATGKRVLQVGFCRSIHGAFGASPDGLIEGENAGLELKVPVPSTHIMYRRAGVLPEEYKFQVHGCMAVTGAERWYFQSWSEGVGSLRVAVSRDDFTEELKAALIEFSRQFEAAWEQEKQAAKEEA